MRFISQRIDRRALSNLLCSLNITSNCLNLVLISTSQGPYMNLETELTAAGYNRSVEEFNRTLIDTLISAFPNRTIDRLACIPVDAIQYAKAVQQLPASGNIPEYVILKALMNIRRRKDCPRGLQRRSPRILRTWLRKLGCSMKASTFRTFCVDCLADMYKSQTVDEVVCHPNEAIQLCNYARKRASCITLSDDIILSTLMNTRKAAGRI